MLNARANHSPIMPNSGVRHGMRAVVIPCRSGFLAKPDCPFSKVLFQNISRTNCPGVDLDDLVLSQQTTDPT